MGRKFGHQPDSDDLTVKTSTLRNLGGTLRTLRFKRINRMGLTPIT